jgi:hypothetical protein
VEQKSRKRGGQNKGVVVGCRSRGTRAKFEANRAESGSRSEPITYLIYDLLHI